MPDIGHDGIDIGHDGIDIGHDGKAFISIYAGTAGCLWIL